MILSPSFPQLWSVLVFTGAKGKVKPSRLLYSTVLMLLILCSLKLLKSQLKVFHFWFNWRWRTNKTRRVPRRKQNTFTSDPIHSPILNHVLWNLPLFKSQLFSFKSYEIIIHKIRGLQFNQRVGLCKSSISDFIQGVLRLWKQKITLRIWGFLELLLHREKELSAHLIHSEITGPG